MNFVKIQKIIFFVLISIFNPKNGKIKILKFYLFLKFKLNSEKPKILQVKLFQIVIRII